MNGERDSQAHLGPAPTRCEKHDLYYDGDGACWKCLQEVINDVHSAAVRPVVERQEVKVPPGTKLNYVPATYAQQILDDVIEPEHMEAPAAGAILRVCLELARFLMGKNKAYGNSALEPLRIFSKADPAEQLRVRLDDKLSRLMRGEAAGEDALHDLVGYWVLLKVAERAERAAKK